MKRLVVSMAVSALLTGGLSTSAIAGKACKKATPSDLAAGAPVLVVTDKATEAEPLEPTVTLPPGVAATSDDPTYTHTYLDIQIDSKKAARGLWVQVGVPPLHDYDLFLLRFGAVIADSNGWNPGRIHPLYEDLIGDQSDGGGKTTFDSETLTGINSPDCATFTIDVRNATGPGGDTPVKIWLGEIKFY